jgi:hypothetical protein
LLPGLPEEAFWLPEFVPAEALGRAGGVVPLVTVPGEVLVVAVPEETFPAEDEFEEALLEELVELEPPGSAGGTDTP